jgi:hypothetical protein
VKGLMLALTMVVLSLLVAGPVLAASDCPDMQPTIPDLRNCVLHAADNGYIHNQGVKTALLAQVDAAQAAVNRGAPADAARILAAFANTVQAQAGKQIDAEHAGHMVEHAQMVIGALRG